MSPLAGGFDVLTVDSARPLDAVIEAKRLRAEGRRFVARIEPPRIRSGFGARLLETSSQYRERVAALDALAHDDLVIDGKPQHETVRLDAVFTAAARDVLALSDGIVVSSWTRHHYLEQILRVTVEPHFVPPSVEPPIPPFERAERPDAAVVWAPADPARDLAVLSAALEELHKPVFVVCAGGEIGGLRAQFVPYERAADVLPRATVVIDNARHQPGSVLEFVRRGVPVAASWLCGAIEFLDGVQLFIPWDRADVLRAVQAALGGERPVLRAMNAASARTLAVTSENVFDAFTEAVGLRTAGETFDLALHIPDRRVAVAVAVAAEAVREAADRVARNAALDAIARNEYATRGHEMKTLLPVDLPRLHALRDLMGLAESVVVRSWTELARITAQFAIPPRHVKLLPSSDDAVPALERATCDGSIVVWAPRTPLVQLAIVTTALEALQRPVTVVCRDGTVLPASAGPRLAKAGAIVDADFDDPGAARALGRLGIPLCVATTSGAREYLTGAQPYRPWHRRSIAAAVEAALDGTAPKERR
jgi:hypothetical protein